MRGSQGHSRISSLCVCARVPFVYKHMCIHMGVCVCVLLGAVRGSPNEQNLRVGPSHKHAIGNTAARVRVGITLSLV